MEAIPVTTGFIGRLEKGLKHQVDLLQSGVVSSPLTTNERALVHRIKERTQMENRNNVTRTNAYWSCYRDYPELHWALLAHMVSRNGGWCMTDLRGELLPHLDEQRIGEHLFSFLSVRMPLFFKMLTRNYCSMPKANERKISLFHLLPHLHISAWMLPVWQDFWTYQDSAAAHHSADCQ